MRNPSHAGFRPVRLLELTLGGAMMLFISYSSQDRTSLDTLTAALRRSQQQVWFDQELGGGDSWWNKILEQIRSCDVFIVALSNHWLQSKPCQSELRYAQALQRPILPIRISAVDSVRVNPLSALQIIDYQDPTVDAGIQLVTALHALQAKPQPLPSPLPEEPPVPFGYLMRLGNTMAEKEISPQQQLQMLIELRSGLDEDGDDPSARSDIAQLLRMLRLRHDVTYRTRSEIDNVLASIEAHPDSSPSPSATAEAKPHPPTTVDEGSTTPTQPGAGPQRVSGPAASQPAPIPQYYESNSGSWGGPPPGASPPQQSSGPTPWNQPSPRPKRNPWPIIAAVAVVLVLVVSAVGIWLVVKPSPPPPPPPPIPAERLSALLLSPSDVNAIMGSSTMQPGKPILSMETSPMTLSLPDCQGALYTSQEPVYAGTGYSGVSGLVSSEPGDNHDHWVNQAAILFPSADKARSFMQTAADKWKGCAGKTVTVTNKGKTYTWTFAQINGSPPKIAVVDTQEGAGGWECQRAMSQANNVIVDVNACGYHISNQGGQITDKIVAKISNE
jgi:hypothetical protein